MTVDFSVLVVFITLHESGLVFVFPSEYSLSRRLLFREAKAD